MSYDFGKHKKTQTTTKIEPSKPEKINSKPIPQPVKKPKKQPILFVPEKKVNLEEYVSKNLDIIKEVNKLFSGLVVRYDQRNIHAKVFSVLSNAFYDPEIFKMLHKKGLLEKTKYAGQWRIK